MRKRSSVFNVVMIISLTFLAKIIGFARDAFIGYRMGAELRDIYYGSVNVTTIVFLGIGSAIATNIIPIIVRNRKEGNDSDSITNIMTAIVLFTGIGSVLYYLLAPVVVPVLVPGYTEEKLALTIEITRWMTPTMLLIGVMYFFVGALQANERFTLPATSSYLFNFLFFVYIALFVDRLGVIGLAAVTTIGWGVQLIYLMPAVIKHKIVPFKWHLDFKDPVLRNYFIGIVPIMLVTLTHQFNIILDNRMASFYGEGKLSALYFGNMLFVAITTVTVNGITAVMFPKFNEKLLETNHEGFYQSVVNVLRSIMLLLIPMSVGMMMVGPHIIQLVFERGMFDASDTAATVVAFIGYTSLMLAFGFVDVLNKAFYALDNRRIPVLVGSVIILTNLVLNYVLSESFGFEAIPMATSMAFYIGAIVSFILFYRREKGFKLNRFGNSLWKILASAVLMAAGIGLLEMLVGGAMPNSEMGILLTVIIDVVAGVVFYGIGLLVLREELVVHNIGKALDRIRR